MDARVDKHLFWTGIVYFAGLYLLHIAWWQALVIGIAMAISWYLTYGRRMIGGVGLLILLLGLGSGSQLVPEPSQWSHVVAMLRSGTQ